MPSMLFRWLRNRRRRRLLASPWPQPWREWLAADMPMAASLSETQQTRLIEIARVIFHEKRWYGRDGLELTDRIRFCIAAQAALLLVGIEHDYYRNVQEIIVGPSAYTVESFDRGIVSDQQVLGQASVRDGHIVLAWDASRHGMMNTEDGHNVVLHEFAHKLDLLDGWGDGTPPLPTQQAYERWVAVMTEHFEQLTEHARPGRRALLRAYGLTHPVEFFAVATEVFFEKSRRLQRELPELYTTLRDYYNQDPASW